MPSTVLLRRRDSMKNKVTAVITVVLGLTAAIGPRTIFPVCSAAEMKMKCYYTSQWELVVGIIAAIVGVGLILINDKKIRTLLSALEIALGALIVLIPTAIVGVCSSPMMHCVSLTRPALIVTGVLEIVTATVSLYFAVENKFGKGSVKVAQLEN